jgi:hypothetical protein
VSANYFRAIGVALARGPGFDEKTDDAPTAKPGVILGYNFWKKRLASDPDIVGKTLTLDRIPHVVVSIAPDQLEGHLALQGRALLVPLERHPRLRADNNVRSNRDIGWVHIHGRLSPGVGMAQGSAAVAAVTARLAKQVSEGLIRPRNPGNAGGGKEPWLVSPSSSRRRYASKLRHALR